NDKCQISNAKWKIVLQDRGSVESSSDSRPLIPASEFSGGCVERATPVPIPNTEVKPLGADGTARATVWESRKPPGLLTKAREKNLAGFFVSSLAIFSHDLTAFLDL